MAADPPAAAVLFLEAPAAGHDARPLRADLLTLIAQILSDSGVAARQAVRSRPLAWTVEMRAGAIHEILHRHIACGQAADLPALAPEIVQILAPSRATCRNPRT